MAVILTTFANHSGNDFLPNLQAEDDAVFKALGEGMLANHYLVFRDSYATRDKLIYLLRLLRQELFLFHYSGHAAQTVLDLPEGSVLGEGIAEMLNKCSNLEVVVLNGCCTVKQARRLHDLGVPVVIGTANKIEDETAMIFSRVFYQSLAKEKGYSFAAAFEDALVATKTVEADARMFRGDEEEDENNDLCWDLYIDPNYNDRGLPIRDMLEITEGTDFKPNTLLVTRLFANPAITSMELEDYRHKLRNRTGKVSSSKRRNAIVNCFPAPVGEALRKLMCPPAEDEEGYDTISNKRLTQIVVAYITMMELLTFTLVAQVFEIMLSYRLIRKVSAFPKELAEQLLRLIILSNEERSLYPYIYLIRQLRTWLEEEEGIEFFVDELAELAEIFEDDNGDFADACADIEALRVRLSTGAISKRLVSGLCKQSEASLSIILGSLGFLSRYTMATVKSIDIVKYKHQPKAIFIHELIRLIDILGKVSVEPQELVDFMDNRSVLLLKESSINDENKMPQFLNLSPFILDKSAFRKHGDASALYFFQTTTEEFGKLSFRSISKPDDAPWIIEPTLPGEEDDPYAQVPLMEPVDYIYEQFMAFVEIINTKKQPNGESI